MSGSVNAKGNGVASAPGREPIALRARLWRQVRDLVRQAVPVVIARASVMLLALVDTIMVGRYASDALAVLGLSLTLITTMLLTGIGLLMGTLVLTAAAFGAGHYAACGIVWRRSLAYAAGLGSLMAVIAGFGEPILLALGQVPDLTREAAPVVWVLGLGLLPQLIFVTTQFFLEGIKRPLPGMVLMLTANALNAVLNFVLVYGHWGAPTLGALGSAWATTIVRAFLAVGAIAYVLRMTDRSIYLRPSRTAGAAPSARLQRRIGFASGMSIGIEGAGFSILGLFAGWLGALPLAAYTIGLNMITFVFMIAVGFGASTAVHVGAAAGRGDIEGARLAGWTGFAMTILVLTAVAAGIAAAPSSLLGLYTDDSALLRTAEPVMAILALVVIADGGQGVIASAVRGLGDTWIASGLHAASFLLVMVPVACLLSFAAAFGPIGLFQGMLVGCLVACGVLAWRFQRLTRWPDSIQHLSSRSAGH